MRNNPKAWRRKIKGYRAAMKAKQESKAQTEAVKAEGPRQTSGWSTHVQRRKAAAG
jgi:predicted nucleic acid-binding Zn ribbon protein